MSTDLRVFYFCLFESCKASFLRDQNTTLFFSFHLPIWCVCCKNLTLFQKPFFEPFYIPAPRQYVSMLQDGLSTHIHWVKKNIQSFLDLIQVVILKNRWNISNRLTPHLCKCEVMLLSNARLYKSTACHLHWQLHFYDNCRNSRALIG